MAGLAGGVMSLFSQIFTAQAQHIADTIKKAFDATVTAYQNGAATLTTTLSQVEQQRSDAVSKLSGKKGGQDQLNQLLPTLDQEIATLQNQQKQTIEQFTQTVADMQLNGNLANGPLSSMLDTWIDINQQIQNDIWAVYDNRRSQY
jgi:peptidoglycan hydrolase CwlO-like protein